MPSGCPTPAKKLAAARQWWKENGRNAEKPARKTGISPKTIRAAIEREGWIEWADAVDDAKLKQPIAIQTQAQREAKISEYHDKRLEKLVRSVDTLGVDPRSATGEVSTITKDSRLINGDSTSRPDLGDLSDSQLDDRLRKLLAAINGDDAEDTDTPTED